MRLMIIDPDEKRGDKLSQALVRRYGWPLVSLKALTGLHEPTSDRHAFVLERPPVDKQQALELDDGLAASDTPLDMIFIIQVQAADSPPGPFRDNRAQSPLVEHYSGRSLLRRVRGEADDQYILNTIERSIDNTRKLTQSEPDAFARMLAAVRSEMPVVKQAAEAVDTAEAQVPENEPQKTETGTASTRKRSMQVKGRLSRRGSGWKPRN